MSRTLWGGGYADWWPLPSIIPISFTVLVNCGSIDATNESLSNNRAEMLPDTRFILELHWKNRLGWAWSDTTLATKPAAGGRTCAQTGREGRDDAMSTASDQVINHAHQGHNDSKEVFTCGNTGMCLTVESCMLGHDRSHSCMSLSEEPLCWIKWHNEKIVMRKTESKREVEGWGAITSPNPGGGALDSWFNLFASKPFIIINEWSHI